MGASEWLCLRQDPELAAEVIVPLRPDRNRAAQHRRGPQSLLTHRWREVDSNHRYRKISHRFETDFCHLHDGSHSRKGFTSFATGDRQFESTSLQR